MMIFVRKGNVLLEVDDDCMNRMLDNGYDIVDKAGNIITKSIPRDAQILRNLYIQSLEQIKALKAEIEALKAVDTAEVTSKPAKRSTKKAE